MTINPSSPIPRHVAIICDGNRRWAKAHAMVAVAGHQQAAKTVFEPLVDRAVELGISYLTFWVFSTENWHRSPAEVDALLELLRQQLDHYAQVLNKREVRIQTIGDLSKFSTDIREKIHSAVEQTKHHTGMTVVFALNYGGRDELTRAVRSIAEQVKSGKLDVDAITPDSIASMLDTAQMPDPELVIRTGGEQRVSGFMPWQAVYAEYVFTPVFFPDLTPAVFSEIILSFGERHRRFGR